MRAREECRRACGTHRAAGGLWPGWTANAVTVIAMIRGQTSRAGGQGRRGGGLRHTVGAGAVLSQRRKEGQAYAHAHKTHAIPTQPSRKAHTHKHTYTQTGPHGER